MTRLGPWAVGAACLGLGCALAYRLGVREGEARLKRRLFEAGREEHLEERYGTDDLDWEIDWSRVGTSGGRP